MPEQKAGRFCPLPAGDRPVPTSVDRWLLGDLDLDAGPQPAGEDPPPRPTAAPFLADLFLYLMSALALAVRNRHPSFDAGFLARFVNDLKDPEQLNRFPDELSPLAPAFPPDVPTDRMALSASVADAAGQPLPLGGLNYAPGRRLADGAVVTRVSDLGWWDVWRKDAGI